MKSVKKENMKQRRRSVTRALLNNQIFAIGGFTLTGNPTSLCEAYDIAKNEWNNIAPLKKGRFMSSTWTSEVNEKIYVFGGIISSINSMHGRT